MVVSLPETAYAPNAIDATLLRTPSTKAPRTATPAREPTTNGTQSDAV